MSVMRDPAGNQLHLVLLQVVSSDEKGPILLRNRLDDEQISLADKTKNKFMMVWAPVDTDVGITTLTELVQEFERIKSQAATLHEEVVTTQRQIGLVTTDNKRLQEENDQKTAALRELQKERDPERLQRQVAEIVEKQTKEKDLEIQSYKNTIADQNRIIEELRASKKKLKEANERLKEKHGG